MSESNPKIYDLKHHELVWWYAVVATAVKDEDHQIACEHCEEQLEQVLDEMQMVIDREDSDTDD